MIKSECVVKDIIHIDIISAIDLSFNLEWVNLFQIFSQNLEEPSWNLSLLFISISIELY